MYCTNCGARLSDDSQFCHVCGTKLEIVPQEKVSEVVTPETKGEFDGVSWDSEAPARPPVPQPQPGPQSQPKPQQQSNSKAPARSNAAPKPAARTSKKAEKQPKKKRGFFFWVLVFIGVMLLVFIGKVLFDYLRIFLL